MAHAPVDGIGGLAHLLVVVGLGHRGAPVDDDGATPLVGDAGGTDVDVAGGTARAHLEADLGEVGATQKEKDAAQLVDREVVVLVVRVDDEVERLDRGERLDGLVGAAEVDADLVAHLADLVGHALVGDLDLGGHVVAQPNQLGVRLREVLAFLGQDGVVVRVELRIVWLLVLHWGLPVAREFVAYHRSARGRAPACAAWHVGDPHAARRMSAGPQHARPSRQCNGIAR